MPEICRFLGIVISMFHKEHNPPHFHAKYGEYNGSFSIEELRMTEGNLPARILGLILEWAVEHKTELLQDWELAGQGKKLDKIKPLV